MLSQDSSSSDDDEERKPTVRNLRKREDAEYSLVKFSLWLCGMLLWADCAQCLHLYSFPVFLLVMAVVGLILHPVRKRVKLPIRVFLCNCCG